MSYVNKSDDFAENSGRISGGAIVVRAILGLIAVVTLYLIITARSGDVGQPFAGDHWTGGVFDWLGVIVFLTGVAFFGGAGTMMRNLVSPKSKRKGSVYGYGSKEQEWSNTVIGFAWVVSGILLIVLTN